MTKKQTAHQHMDCVRNELRFENNPTDGPLLDRLERCFAHGIDPFRCKSPACVRCRFINIRRQQRGTIEMLGHFPNEKLAFVTVVVGAATDLNGVSALIAKSRRDTKNRFVAARQKDERWNDTYLRAWYEIDAVGTAHMPLLPPDRKDLVPALAPMAASLLTPTWLPTWHGILVLNDLSAEEAADEFRCQWKLDHQVDVRPFKPIKALNPMETLTANLNKLTSYANKFHCSTSLRDWQKEPWPIQWQAQFFGWLHDGKRNAFEGLRMSINQANPKQEIEVCEAVSAVSPMPFTHSFSGVPMHYNTGAWA